MAEQHNTITVYGHPGCMAVAPAIHMLKKAEADYEYINIFNDFSAREKLRDLNDGYESVPTLEFPDGSVLTEPSAGALRNKLQTMGYEVPASTLVTGNITTIIIAVGIILALLRAFGAI